MAARGIAILPVSEIENLALLPGVSRAIAESEGHIGPGLQECLDNLADAVFASLKRELIEGAVVRYSKRRIDSFLKRVEFGEAKTVAELVAQTEQQLAALDVSTIADKARVELEKAKSNRDLTALLACYDNKGLLALAAMHLKHTRANDFEDWLTRALLNDKAPAVLTAIRAALPRLEAT